MSEISGSRCFNHPQREAAARCPECKRFFCRECVNEHSGRLICAACLKKAAKKKARRRISFSPVFKIIQVCLGIIILWGFFYVTGKALVAVPAAFHEKTLWYKALYDAATEEGDKK